MKNVFSEIKFLIKCDLTRYTGGGHFLSAYRRCEGFKYSVWFRIASGLKPVKYKCLPLYFIAKRRLHSLMHSYGIVIVEGTQIGPGLYIGHYGGIVVNYESVIGRNFNISHGVTIGRTNRGSKLGVAVIGDNVYVGPGAKIIGAVKIGNYAAIGANAVVTKDIPENAVVGGVPAHVISYKGSTGYVDNTI